MLWRRKTSEKCLQLSIAYSIKCQSSISLVELEGLFTVIAGSDSELFTECQILNRKLSGQISRSMSVWLRCQSCFAQKQPCFTVSIISNVHVLLFKVIGADHDMQKMIEKYEENRDQILNPNNMQHHLQKSAVAVF